MYWADRATIYRANLDGTAIESLATSPTGHVEDIALDLNLGKIYWTDRDWVHRANLDGTVIEDLITSDSGFLNGMALDLSVEKMYWIDRQATDDAVIQRANLDGSVVVEDLFNGYGLAGVTVDSRVPGDCNKDGLFSLDDGNLVIACLAGPSEVVLPECSCADATGDRSVALDDFAVILNGFGDP